jgi:RNA polymerase sigma-70 factor (ECF subfamily)
MTEEAQIIASVLDGEVNAFEPLVTKYEKPIFNLMYRATGSFDEAADLTQEAFLKAYDKLYQFQKDRSFFSWFYALALNIGRDHLRCKMRSRPWDCENPEYADENEEAGSEDSRLSEDYQSLVEALEKLPVDYREAIVLRYREGRTMKEIAEILNLSTSGAKMRVCRGLEKLRIILGDEKCSLDGAGSKRKDVE